MTQLFDINSTWISNIPLYILPALINLVLAVFVTVKLPGTRLNRVFVLFIFLLGVAQFSDGMMHMSVTEQAATRWQKISFSPWVFIAAAGAIVVLEYTRLSKLVESGKHVAPFILPAFLLEMIIFAGDCKHTLVYNSAWGWIANPDNSAANHVVYMFIAGVSLLMPVLLWRAYWKNRKDKIARRPYLLLLIGVTVPYLGGLISEIIFPLALHIDLVPLTTPLMTVFSVIAYIAIKKYNLLDFSPRKQVDRIIDTMSEGVVMVDLNGHVMYTNNSFRALLGYNQDELYGSNSSLLLNGLGSVVWTENSGTAELNLKTKSGESIWAITKNSPCLNDHGIRIGTTHAITDISELKKTLEENQYKKMLLKRAQSIAKVGHWELDFTTGKANCSEETCKIYGLPATETVYDFEQWVSLIHPQDRPAVLLQLQCDQDSYKDSDIEHRIVLSDGTVKHIHSICKFEFGENGKPTGLFGVCQDITEITVAKESLRNSASELETYIYKSSHDLHAPLSSILGLIEVSKQDISDPLAVKYIAMIESQAKKLNVIRTQFIRAMEIKETVKRDDLVYPKVIIQEMISLMHNNYGYSRIKLNINIPNSAIMRTNLFLLKTVLVHLIENGIRYQNHALDHSFLNIDFIQTSDSTIITVEDNGIGIPMEIQDKIFDMYFKGTNSPEGSGLGLYLVKKAIEKLEGKVQVKSTAGRGTKFTLSFAKGN